MDKEERVKTIRILLGIAGLILTVTGLTYASMYIKIESQKSNIIKSGCLKVAITDNGSVNLTNEMPKSDEEGLKQKAYEYTIENTCNLDAYYETTYNVLTKTTSGLENKVKVAIKGDSYLPPVMVSNLGETTPLDTLSESVRKTYLADSGYLKANEKRSFQLYTWIDKDVTEFTGDYAAKLAVNAYMNEGTEYGVNTIGYKILSQNSVQNQTETNPNYNNISPSTGQTSGLFKTENKEHIYRGNVTNNYVSFANKTWRIIKINKDGSIKIILDASAGTSTYNAASNAKEKTLYKTSNIKSFLETWYNNNLKNYEEYIETEAKYCSDASEKEENGVTKYGGYQRNVDKKSPRTTCDTEDEYQKIGLITVDEVSLAGGKQTTANTNFYLYNSSIGGYYTMSPSSYNTTAKVFAAASSTSSIYETATTSTLAIRPVITIKRGAGITGEGTETNKYQIKGETKDTTAPTIKYVYTTNDYSKTNKTIYMGATDEAGGTGLAGYLIKTNNTKPAATDTAWETSELKTYKSAKTYANGTYYVFAKDKAGNVSEGEQIKIDKVQSASPTCSISISPSDGITSKTLTITSPSKLHPVGYSWDNEEYTSFNRKVVKANGVYTAYVKDMAGNTGSCNMTITGIKEVITAETLISKVGTGGLVAEEHPATSQLQATTDYRYTGKAPDNYIKFNNETWRIIGIFDTDDGTGKLEKRIKIIGDVIRNKWNTTTTNNWETASSKNYLNNNEYWNNNLTEEAKSKIADAKWYLGGKSTWSDASVGLTEHFYIDERGTTVYSGNPTSWTGKVGLMYPSDYGYATSGGTTTNRQSCLNKELINWDESSVSDCKNNDWIYISDQYQWTITTTANSKSGALSIAASGLVGTAINYVDYYAALRPTVYLKADASLTGNGTTESPYEIK